MPDDTTAAQTPSVSPRLAAANAALAKLKDSPSPTLSPALFGTLGPRLALIEDVLAALVDDRASEQRTV
jgi:hypothetical protein